MHLHYILIITQIGYLARLLTKKGPSSYLPGPLIIISSVLRLMEGVYHASKASAGNS